MKLLSGKHKSSNEIINKQLNTITVIFSIIAVFFIGVGILIGVFSAKSVDQIIEARKELTDHKNELFTDVSAFKESINEKVDQRFFELENKVQKLEQIVEERLDKKINEYETKFEKISGENLKKPKLRLIYEGRSLEGQIIKLIKVGDKFAIPSLGIENIGDREVSIPSINIFFSLPVNKLNVHSERGMIESYWEEKSGADIFYPKQFQYVIYGIREDLSIINPQELDELPITLIENFNEEWNEIDCMLKVFYATEPPEIVRFKLSK